MSNERKKGPYGCKCQTLAHKLVGDGCDECQPMSDAPTPTVWERVDFLEAENDRLREALEEIVTTLAVGEDWCGFCGTLNHHPHNRDCPYPIARHALDRETTDE